MKKIGLGMSAVIVAIGLFLFWRYATYGHSQEQPASNVHMQQVLEKFYQNPGNYNFFDKDGIMQTGWVDDNDKRYYMDLDGIMQTGTITVDDQNYELQADGSLKK